MILLTGATGYVGRAVLTRLAGMPGAAPLRVLVRRPAPVPAAGVEVVAGDLLDPDATARAVAGCDRIVHLAGLTHSPTPAAYHAVNAEGTRSLVAAARRHGVRRLVFLSTRAIHPTGGAYAVSKRRAEEEVATLEEAVVVRLGEVYGAAGGRGIADVVAWLRRRRWIPVVGAGEYTLAPVHVADAAAAVAGALASGAPGRTYTVTGPETLTFVELVAAIGGALGVRPRLVHVPVGLARRLVALAARTGRGPLACDQIDRLICPKPAMEPDTPSRLGFTPRGFRAELPRLTIETGP